MGLNPEYHNMSYLTYALVGMGNAILLTGSTALINNVIWEYSFSGGYVFAIFSLIEKLVNGFVIIKVSNAISSGEKWSINQLNSVVPIICHLLSVCLIWMLSVLS